MISFVFCVIKSKYNNENSIGAVSLIIAGEDLMNDIFDIIVPAMNGHWSYI